MMPQKRRRISTGNKETNFLRRFLRIFPFPREAGQATCQRPCKTHLDRKFKTPIVCAIVQSEHNAEAILPLPSLQTNRSGLSP
jgi:hypothetical protein